MDFQTKLANLILIQLESINETNSVNAQLVLLHEVLRDAKQLAELTLNKEKEAA